MGDDLRLYPEPDHLCDLVQQSGFELLTAYSLSSVALFLCSLIHRAQPSRNRSQCPDKSMADGWLEHCHRSLLRSSRSLSVAGAAPDSGGLASALLQPPPAFLGGGL